MFTEVSKSMKQHADNSGKLWPLNKHLPYHGRSNHGLTAQLYLKFLLVTQQEVPFTNTSEATKRSSNWTENGKCTNVTNRRSREGLSTPFYTNPLQLQDARFVLVRIYSLSRIYRDLIMHNYRSNQSALMTRFGTDLRHQYRIFGGKSQTSFSQNATWIGSKEGRLFSQANLPCFEGQLFYMLLPPIPGESPCFIKKLDSVLGLERWSGMLCGYFDIATH